VRKKKLFKSKAKYMKYTLKSLNKYHKNSTYEVTSFSALQEREFY
jgi:hypothetical protein